MRRAISRIRENSRTTCRRRRAMTLKASRITRREGKPIRTERIAIDLAQIIADLPGPRVRVFELQDISRAADLAHLDGAAVVDGKVGLLVGTGFRGEGLGGAAGGDAAVVFALAADVEVDGEGARVADVSGTFGGGVGVGGGDWGAAGDEGGVTYAWGGRGDWVWYGDGREGEVARRQEGRHEGC